MKNGMLLADLFVYSFLYFERWYQIVTYIFDFVTCDDANDYRVVKGDSYEIALDLFRLAVPDCKEILHVFSQFGNPCSGY